MAKQVGDVRGNELETEVEKEVKSQGEREEERRVGKGKNAKASSPSFCLADCTRARIYGFAIADMTCGTLGCAF